MLAGERCSRHSLFLKALHCYHLKALHCYHHSLGSVQLSLGKAATAQYSSIQAGGVEA